MILPDLPSVCKMGVLHTWGVDRALDTYVRKKVYYARPVSESYSLEKCPY